MGRNVRPRTAEEPTRASIVDVARRAGVSVATVSACGWAGFVLGPPLIGQLADATSLRTALWTVPVLTAVIAVVSARQLRPR